MRLLGESLSARSVFFLRKRDAGFRVMKGHSPFTWKTILIAIGGFFQKIDPLNTDEQKNKVDYVFSSTSIFAQRAAAGFPAGDGGFDADSEHRAAGADD
jgi:hypothetical protein